MLNIPFLTYYLRDHSPAKRSFELSPPSIRACALSCLSLLFHHRFIFSKRRRMTSAYAAILSSPAALVAIVQGMSGAYCPIVGHGLCVRCCFICLLFSPWSSRYGRGATLRERAVRTPSKLIGNTSVVCSIHRDMSSCQ